MDRGLIVGAIAFVVAFGAERLFASVEKDIARYEAMRKMSGQPPMFRELLSVIGGAVGGHRGAPTNGTSGFVADLANDVVRYAKMKGM